MIQTLMGMEQNLEVSPESLSRSSLIIKIGFVLKI